MLGSEGHSAEGRGEGTASRREGAQLFQPLALGFVLCPHLVILIFILIFQLPCVHLGCRLGGYFYREVLPRADAGGGEWGLVILLFFL